MTDPENVWSGFSADPRDPEQAVLLASDADRDLVHGVLGEAFADGRLDRAELDSRTATTESARTLGELLDPLVGLVPKRPVKPSGTVAMSPAEIELRAVQAWRKDRREAFWGLISVSAIVWTIWLVGAFEPSGFEPSFPWPLFVSVAALLNLGRIQFGREDSMSEERRRLERKQRKAIEKKGREPGEEQ
jgi:hypothetical protein